MARRSLLALVALTLLAAGCSQSAKEAAKTSSAGFPVGLVFDIGGRGDKSFNDAAYTGLLRAQRELGVSAELLEPASSEDREAAMRLFAARGLDLVIGVGFIFSSDVDRVARDFPQDGEDN